MRYQYGYLQLLLLLLVLCGAGCEQQHADLTDSGKGNGNSPSDLANRRAVEPVPTLGTRQMAARLKQLNDAPPPGIDFTIGTDHRIEQYRQKVAQETNPGKRESARAALAHFYLTAGRNDDALTELNKVREYVESKGAFHADLASLIATTHLRQAELDNCVGRHNADSCLFPLRGGGLHYVPDGSRRAIVTLTEILQHKPDDLSARWLLNFAHMTLGEYPDAVPERWRIPVETWASEVEVSGFTNVASQLGIDVCKLAGGSILEDFDNDGDLDIVASSWGARDQLHYFRNEGDGRFEDRTEAAGLIGETGGLNICQADYDGDGWVDILVLRGAWLQIAGAQPNSLLRNRGDGTFDDVTQRVGLYSEHPTQTAAWGDFNNDGHLDLFIGNETRTRARTPSPHPCELYMNQGNGTFKEQARQFGIAHLGFVKGIACGDYDNDGDLDLFLSQLGDTNHLYRNDLNGAGQGFVDVAAQAGVADAIQTFPTWFFDFDNDGDLDLFVAPFAGFTGDNLAPIAADYLGLPCDLERPRLYRNNGDGTFANIAAEVGLVDAMLAMGANFGDIDNDGYLDIYIGTGEPNLHTLVPNRMYRNSGGKEFQNVTTSARVGHLQKGHGISFGDIDNDGDQDIYAVMGGAFDGDVAFNALFLNNGNDNSMISLALRGEKSNRQGVGARVELIVESDSGTRHLHRALSSGGSFGASPLRVEVGLGAHPTRVTARVAWPAGTVTTHTLAPTGAYELSEDGGQRTLERLPIPIST